MLSSDNLYNSEPHDTLYHLLITHHRERRAFTPELNKPAVMLFSDPLSQISLLYSLFTLRGIDK